MLKANDWVEVRSEAEILATLDARGKLEGLPFMPEMLAFCGRRYPVYKRADKTCDTVSVSALGMRRLHDTVHLGGLRCDGQAHDGCQAGCLLFWKEAWLKKVGAAPTREDVELPLAAAGGPTTGQLNDLTRSQQDATLVYSCQATELKGATAHLSWWTPGQYIDDVQTGNTKPMRVLHGLAVMFFNKVQGANRKFLPQLLLFKKGRKYPFVEGKAGDKTPRERLNLQAGEWVEVKSLSEIEQTLDEDKCNRGLSFDREMVRYCGQRARVLRRVGKIIDERTGKMLHIGSDCIILDNVVCCGDYHQFCPRSTYPYWREIWLRRVS